MTGLPLDRHSIEGHLGEVAEELSRNGYTAQAIVVTVGGSFMALHNLRASTRDVDSIVGLDEPLKSAVAVVAERHGLRPDWLNDNARPFKPQGLTIDDCEVLYEQPTLVVLGPQASWVFLMKLYASRGGDDELDMLKLWPLTDFADAADVVRRFYDAYPLEKPDEHLEDHVHGLIGRAQQSS